MDISNNEAKIILAIVTALAGAGVVFKFVKRNQNRKKTGEVTIKNSNIGGDVAGRDIKK